ncbi:MAG: phosphotransferase [Gammaproteobacteria bacterium]
MTTRCPPERVLARVPAWRGAAALSCCPLEAGRSNRSWRVTADGREYVLRLSSGRVPVPVFDPRRELVVHRAAASAGLAPPLEYADPEAGILVTHFLEGEVVPAPDFADPGTLGRIGPLLRRVGELPDPGGGYTLGGAGEAYLSMIRDDALQRYGGRLVEGLHALPPPADPRVCHMDPVVGNLVRTDNGLQLIDWEFAVAGDPLFDVAAIVAYHDLDAAAARCLLEAWADSPDERIRARLTRLVWAHDALHWLWLVATGAGRDGEMQRLEDRLAVSPTVSDPD